MQMQLTCPEGHTFDLPADSPAIRVLCPECQQGVDVPPPDQRGRVSAPSGPAVGTAGLGVGVRMGSSPSQMVLTCPEGHRIELPADSPAIRVLCPECHHGVDVPPPDQRRHVPSASKPLLSATGEVQLDRTPPAPALPAQTSTAPPAAATADAGTPPLELVARGIGLHYARMTGYLALLFLLAVVLEIGILGAASESAQRTLGVLDPVLKAVAMVADAALPLLGILGSILCLWWPLGSRAVACLLLSILFDAIAIALPHVLVWLVDPRLASEPSWLVVLIGVALVLAMNLASWTLFLMFLARLCDSLGEASYAHETRQLIPATLTFLFVAAPLYVALMFFAAYTPVLGFVLLFILILLAPFLCMRFIRRIMDLLAGVRQAVLRAE